MRLHGGEVLGGGMQESLVWEVITESLHQIDFAKVQFRQ